jgi:hypothetical protein
MHTGSDSGALLAGSDPGAPLTEFDPGALLGRSFSLAHGPRVRLRLARMRDLPAIQALFERRGIVADELERARLVRVDPRERIVICATALIGSGEKIVGIGAIDIDPQAASEPSVLVVDDRASEGLDRLLASALVGRARGLARGRTHGLARGWTHTLARAWAS